ncbi:MAG: thiamine pyrophosphate-binding protein [Thermodesulfobacteriota bacterium]
MTQTTGGAILARMLNQEGVEHVFGIIDGTYTQLFVNFAPHGISLVTPRHESIALHMAGAYARLTGRLGVAIASNGPGVANALSGVAVENAEGNRVLLITSSRRPNISYPDRGGAYQYFDQVGVIGRMAKWSAWAPSFDRVPELMRQALRECHRGRPGVVHLDVPETIMNGKTEEPPAWQPHEYRRLEPVPPPPALVERAAAMLSQARLPLIHAGSGVIHADAFAELAALAHRLHAPVTTSWAARGALAEDDPLAWPMVHIEACNQLRNQADLALCLGARLGETDWWGKAPYWAQPGAQKLIQVDIDEAALGRTRRVDLAVLADIKLFLTQLLAALGEAQPSPGRREAVAKLAQTRDADRAKLDERLKERGAPMLAGHVARACGEFFGPEAVAVFDGGNTAVWANFFHQVRTPNTLLTTNHMGHLGAGVGQALGAAVARPEKPVYCIIGDGAMGFHPQEIETAVRNGLKPIFLVCCDRQWGMVKINQSFALKPWKTMWKKSLEPDETVNTELGEIQFDKLAEAMGGHGERVSSPDELKPALERCQAAGKCAVIHVDVDPVKHMWAPGLLHFKKMHQEPKGR